MNKKYIAYLCYAINSFSLIMIFIYPSYLWLFLMPLSIIIGIYNMHSYKKENYKKAKNYIENFRDNLNCDDFDVTYDGLYGIFIETQKEKIGILSRENLEQEFNIEYINFSDISDVHLIQNDTTVLKTAKGDMIGKSLIGGALLGGTGAVIGAVSANKNVNETLNKLTLQIVVNDILNPIRNVKFIDLQQGISKNSKNYELVFEVIDKWYKRIELIIKKKINKEAI